MEENFDTHGLLFALNRIEEAGIKKCHEINFCQICWGAGLQGLESILKGINKEKLVKKPCLGGICKEWKLDKEKLEEVIQQEKTG
ncbi:MAG: hypothetical protein PHG83_03365 [Patescibacteria group bacterium]|nr:hypothetical protein [Patescibacteria group bacterium]